MLYAFLSDREVLYIGKTTQPLGRRMHGYQRPGPTQVTNIAVHAKILGLLGSQRQVDVYALCDTEAFHHGEFRVNLAAGLEDTLVRELRPQWNKIGR